MSGVTTSKHSSFFDLIRVKNLGFLLFLQLSVYWLCRQYVESSTSFFSFFIAIVIPTIIISAFGYIYNDFIDYESDQINLKRQEVNKTWKPSDLQKISTRTGISAVISVIIATIIFPNWILFVLLSISLITIYLYSKYLKCIPLLGNLVIGILSALSVYLPYLFHDLEASASAYQEAFYIFLFGFIFFVFVVTLMREMVKDLEDIKGDDAKKCKTLPVLYGESLIRNIVLALSIITMLLLMSWSQNFSMILNGYIMLFSMLPLMLTSAMVVRSTQYAEISKYLKYLMVSSSFMIFIFYFTHQI